MSVTTFVDLIEGRNLLLNIGLNLLQIVGMTLDHVGFTDVVLHVCDGDVDFFKDAKILLVLENNLALRRYRTQIVIVRILIVSMVVCPSLVEQHRVLLRCFSGKR